MEFRLKLLAVLFLLALACFGAILLALRLQSRFLLIVGTVGCSLAVLTGLAVVFVGIFLALKSPP